MALRHDLIKLFLIVVLSVEALGGSNLVWCQAPDPDTCCDTNPYRRIEATLTQRYRDRVAQVITEAKAYLATMPKVTAPRIPAVVFDLDETLMDNRAYFIRHREYDPQLWEVWVYEADAPVIPESLAFYQWLKERGYGVFFISGRKESWRTATENNLKQMGVIGYERLYLKPNQFNGASMGDFKVVARQEIEKQGYEVQLLLGDQQSDFKGGIGKGFKLPNPMYVIP